MLEKIKNLFFESEVQDRADESKFLIWYQKQKKNIWILGGGVFFVINYIVLVFRYIYCFIYLDRIIVSNSLWYLIVAGIFPYALWALFTLYEYFNFYKPKIMVLKLIIFHTILVLTQMVYTIFWDISVPLLLKIKITSYMTQEMVCMTARGILAVFVILSIYLQGKYIYAYLKDIRIREILERFKIKHAVDTRENKENLYDLSFVRDLETGKSIKIKQEDRYTHMFITGGSGIGKSALALENIALSDINKKYVNKLKREEALFQMLKNGEAHITAPFAEFEEKCISPYPQFKEKYANIYKTYPDCGVTIMAPDDSMINRIIEMAMARGMSVNVIDPSRKVPKYSNEKLKGFDLFFVPLDLEEEMLAKTITERANMFTEMLVVVNEIRGRVENYFESINKTLTRTIAIICMLYANLNGRQTDFTEVQDCLGNFSLLTPMINDICRRLNIIVEVNSLSGNKKGITGEELGKSREEIEEKRKNQKNSRENPFYRPLYVAKQELLGDGAEDMFNQGRGLRNLMDYILGEIRIRKVLINENGLDFDKILRDNEITVINTALIYGEQYSKLLGIMTLYSMKIATFRRNPDTSSLHTFIVDEVPQYIDPMFETMIALFRKYHIPCVFAIQAFSQFEKNDMTKYLKGIFKTCGTHFMFGRATEEEMETYSKLSGMEAYNMVQATKSTNSIFSKNPSNSKSDRVTESTRTVMEGRKIRLRDFQEITIIYSDEGRVMDAKLGKLFFVKKKEYKEKKDKRIPQSEWKKFIPSYLLKPSVETLHLVPTEEKKEELQELVAASNMVHYSSGEVLYLNTYEREMLENKIEEGHLEENNYAEESTMDEEIEKLLYQLDNEER